MSHEPLLVGIDAGGTSTRAVLTNLGGECLGYGVGGRGNPISAGPDRAADGVLDAIDNALRASGRAISDLSTVVAAMAGSRAAGGDWLRERLVDRGFRGDLKFESDLLAAYFSAAASPFGYALVSGTGACVIRVQDGCIAKAGDGLGWLLGDRGSGFSIGQAIARAAVQDLDGTGPATALTDKVLEHCGVERSREIHQGRTEDLEELITALYARPPIELAALAPFAFEMSDAVATDILAAAGEHLADTLASVLEGPGPLAIGGGVLARTGPVRDAFLARLGGAVEGLEIRVVRDGAVGAAMLAVRAAGGVIDDQLLGRLTTTVARF
ncbi:N-acetylglucosamine kinase of eukaryotic type [Microbacterium esteraromaticum]|uniref:N-acetylglucosamine kinase of eukaryotic type n=1 Tax=Microbacterium esteraromaticum TaxID=57043 RepID=A0A1R4JIJ4_9MICO|nr:BadF/BadG/BcrA/BcrD ATPase family protein [Microbacterium esteraromaticum]SJN31573.1 N-acetylglucosamine kinase of eukaryotic type [Microbacterium esteraromaticum]